VGAYRCDKLGMLNFILAIATAIFGIDRRVGHPYVTRLQPAWSDWQRRSRRDDAIAAARGALDGVDHPFIL
jgi:hypothetical protein